MNGLYAILDESNFNFSNLKDCVQHMINFKINIFQIRIKSKFNSFHIETIKSLKSLCRKNNCLLLLNDNVKLADELDLDGVHIGLNDLNFCDARKILGNNKIIGVSCYNNISDAIAAEQYGASYVSFGSIFKTSTKVNPTKLNISTFTDAKNILNIPICLIGGINTNNVQDVINLNCDLIAISKGLSSKKDVELISKMYYEKNKII